MVHYKVSEKNCHAIVRTHISNSQLVVRADDADGVSRLMQAFQPNRASNLVRLVSLPDILRSIDELEILGIRLDHPDGEVNLLERVPAHVVVIRQLEVFRSAKMRDANGPELQANGSLSQPRKIGHAALEALLEIELGVIVDFALEAASWLLWEIVVAIGERSVQ
jgi:hypothetical protein